jgi:hypothetical protein
MKTRRNVTAALRHGDAETRMDDTVISEEEEGNQRLASRREGVNFREASQKLSALETYGQSDLREA